MISCDRCSDEFNHENDLTGGPFGGLFCDPCYEAEMEILADEEMK